MCDVSKCMIMFAGVYFQTRKEWSGLFSQILRNSLLHCDYPVIRKQTGLYWIFNKYYCGQFGTSLQLVHFDNIST